MSKLYPFRLLVQEEKIFAERSLSSVSWFKDIFRLKGSAIHRVWKATFVFTIWSIVVSVAQNQYQKDWRLTNSIIPMMSVVVGLLLVFRNGSSFARWEDGRKTFGAMSSAIRNLCRYTWVNVGMVDYDEIRGTFRHAKWTDDQQKEKVQALRLAVAVMVTCKHHVRQEFGTDYEDLHDLIPHKLLRQADNKGRMYGTLPACGLMGPRQERYLSDDGSPSGESAILVQDEFNRPSIPLPLIVIHYLQAYYAKCKATGFLTYTGPAGYNYVTTLLTALTTELDQLERLSRMPVPMIYGIHLKQVVSLYLFLLPLCLVDSMRFSMIPFVTAMSFILLGIEGIASEIEQPFGRDFSDLPLDLFCAELRNEVEHLIAHMPDSLDDF